MALRQQLPLLHSRENVPRRFAAASSITQNAGNNSMVLLSLGASAAGSPRITMRVASKGAYICRDCGYIYNDRKPFDKLPDNYFCPVCGAPKRRFKPYDSPVTKNANDLKVRKARKAELKNDNLGGALPVGIAIGLVALIGTYFYLNKQF